MAALLFVQLQDDSREERSPASSTPAADWQPLPPLPATAARQLISPVDQLLIGQACRFLAAAPSGPTANRLYVSLLWGDSALHTAAPRKFALVDAVIRALYATFPLPGQHVDLVVFPPGPTLLYPADHHDTNVNDDDNDDDDDDVHVPEYLPLHALDDVAYLFLVDFAGTQPGVYHPSLASLPPPSRGLSLVVMSLHGDLSAPRPLTADLLAPCLCDAASPAQQARWQALRRQHAAGLLFDVTCVGGTFDHFHVGHKILVSMTAFVTRRRVELGVTSPSMLTRKAYAELVEPLDARIANASQFCRLINPSLAVQLTVLEEPFGPILTVADMRALVVSEETASAVGPANAKRAERGLAPIVGLVVGVLSPADSLHASAGDSEDRCLETRIKLKASSTAIRACLADKQAAGSQAT